jgi:aspartokinase-like uncharacterized kinase
MWVVKLGGSLLNGPYLLDWLEGLARYGAGRIVIVPGGGPFADQVRTAQTHWGFDDGVGHRMAMLGMAQFGLMLAGLQSTFVPAADTAEIERTLAQGQVALWLPTRLESVDVPRNWSVTSDSLAAWLAGRLEAARLVLVKSVRLDATELSAAELALRGVVDESFPEMLSRTGLSCMILAAADHAAFAGVLRGDADAGLMVTI